MSQKSKLQERRINLPVNNFNLAPLPKAGKPKLRHMKECLSLSHWTFHFILFLDEIFNHVRKSRGPRPTYCSDGVCLISTENNNNIKIFSRGMYRSSFFDVSGHYYLPCSIYGCYKRHYTHFNPLPPILSHYRR